MQFDKLRCDVLVKNAKEIAAELQTEFGEQRGITKLAHEIVEVAQFIHDEADRLTRPAVWLRLATFVAVLVFLGLTGWVLISLKQEWAQQSLLEVVDHLANIVIAVAGPLLALLGVEAWFKRKQVLEQLHRLRSFAHVIDMHQFGKYPTRLERSGETADDNQVLLGQYLNQCIRMLAIVGKLAAVLAQQLRDGAVLEAVNDVEQLCTELSQSLYQKIALLDVPAS